MDVWMEQVAEDLNLPLPGSGNIKERDQLSGQYERLILKVEVLQVVCYACGGVGSVDNAVNSNQHTRQCYSPTCGVPSDAQWKIMNGSLEPNGAQLPSLNLKDQIKSFQSSTQDKAWHDFIDMNLETLSHSEVKRQEIIFELFMGERDYVRDLEWLLNMKRDTKSAEVFASPAQEESSLADVFSNADSILHHHLHLLKQWQEVQVQSHPFIKTSQWLEPLLNTILTSDEAYVEYIANYPRSVRTIRRLGKSQGFADLLKKWQEDKRSKNLDLKAFVIRPLQRLQRYPLLLGELKKCSDAEDISDLIVLIDRLIKSAQTALHATEEKIGLLDVKENLEHQGIALALDDPQRSLILRSNVTLASGSERLLILLDNYLLILKDTTTLHLQQAFPLDFVSDVKDLSQSNVISGSYTRSLRRLKYSLSFQYRASPVSLIFDAADTRNEWREQLQQALSLLAAVRDHAPVVELVPLTEALPSAINSSASFTAATREMIMIGADDGVYVGFKGIPKSFQRVLSVPNVSRITVSQELQVVLVQSQNNLTAYHLYSLVSEHPTKADPRPPQRIAKGVKSYTLGLYNARQLLVTALHSPDRSDLTVFKIYEAIPISERAPRRNLFGSIQIDLFKPFTPKDIFTIPGQLHDMHLLSNHLMVTSSNGAAVIDLARLSTFDLPQWPKDRRTEANQLHAKLKSAQPLAIIKRELGYLLVFNRFGILVDKHGTPQTGHLFANTVSTERETLDLVEWQGSVQTCSFLPPYLVLIEQQAIQVRHIDSLAIVHVSKTGPIKCTCANIISEPPNDITHYTSLNQSLLYELRRTHVLP